MTKRQTLSDDQIEALRAQHGDVAAIDTIMGTAVFRCPTPEEWDRNLKMLRNAREEMHAPRELATKCLVHPDVDTWNAWLSKKPGIPKAADGPITRLAGLDQGAAAVYALDFETVTVTTVVGPIKVKGPDERQWNEFRRKANDDPFAAFEFLAMCCAVEPARAELKSHLDKRPGLAATLTQHIQKIAGFEENERGKG